jgi:hypothetical protein
MAHFAELDSNNIVLRVLVVPNEHESNGQEYLAETVGLGGTWIQTSYNASIRGKFAGVGDTYDSTNDRFISPKPHASWSLDENFMWQAPTPCPESLSGKANRWDEPTLSWIEVTND